MMEKIWLAISWLVVLLLPATAVQAGWGIDAFLSTRMNSSEMVTAADRLSEIGAGWTRQEFNYENIGGPSGTNYGADDEALDKTLAKGIQVVGLLNYSGGLPSATDWENFVANVVSHYAAKVAAWEVINEPNASSRNIAVATYADYLSRSYGKIKQFDSSATVLGGVTAMADYSWLEQLISAGGCGSFDALSIHPYRTVAPETVRFGEGDYPNYIGTVVALLRRSCSGKKLWITETGYRAGEVGSGNQANWLARSFVLARTYSEVDQVLSYVLRDDSSGDWGVMDSGFNPRTAFGRVQQVFSQIGTQSYTDDIVITSRSQIEAFDSADGWGQQFNINGSASLATTSGVFGNGMQIGYSFTAGSAAVILTKEIPISGTPSALGLYLSGDNSRAIWRLRFNDAGGETFQALLGQGVSDWRYKQVDLSNTGVMNSWGGDGAIQYPITFNSIVLDRDSGASSGTVKVDALVAVTGAADFRAVKYGGTVAAWKAVGSGTASVCGQSLTLGEEPTYLSGASGCGSNSVEGVASSSTPTTAPESTSTPTSTKKKKSTSAKATPSPSPSPTADPAKTTAKPDRWFAYATGEEAITIKLEAMDTNGQPMTVPSWEIAGHRSSTNYTAPTDSSTPAVLKATEPGLEELEIRLAGGLVLPNKLKIIWLPPDWKNLFKFADLPADKILTIDGNDPETASGTKTFEATTSVTIGIRAILPGIDPVFVYVSFEGTSLVVPLEKQADGSWGGVMLAPSDPTSLKLSVMAFDQAGATIGQLAGTLNLVAPTVAVAPASARRLPNWVIYVVGGLLVAVGFGYLFRIRWLSRARLIFGRFRKQ